jgi:hypothetical protein
MTDVTPENLTQRESKRQQRLFADWESYCGIPSQQHAANKLGLSWVSYHRYRLGKRMVPLAVLLAMNAIAHSLPAWGTQR